MKIFEIIRLIESNLLIEKPFLRLDGRLCLFVSNRPRSEFPSGLKTATLLWPWSRDPIRCIVLANRQRTGTNIALSPCIARLVAKWYKVSIYGPRSLFFERRSARCSFISHFSFLQTLLFGVSLSLASLTRRSANGFLQFFFKLYWLQNRCSRVAVNTLQSRLQRLQTVFSAI